jgi:D-alanyl-D-alanine carboxypeptidase
VRPTVLLRVCGALVALAFFLASPASASPLRGRLHAALAGFDGPGTGAIAVDLATGRAVYAHNADRSLLPASNEKLALTYAALVALGPSFRMCTEVLGEGRLVDGTVWHGDLILRGYGDPTLDRSGLFELAGRLRATGVRRVTGSLIADESFFDSRRSGPGWKAYFVPQESSPLSALSVEGRSALETAKLLREAFRAAGVSVQGRTKLARAGGWPLAVRFSPPLPRSSARWTSRATTTRRSSCSSSSAQSQGRPDRRRPARRSCARCSPSTQFRSPASGSPTAPG